MSRIQDTSSDMRLLLSALCDDMAGQDDFDKLEASVGSDHDGISLIVDYLQLHSDLLLELKTRQASEAVLREIGGISREEIAISDLSIPSTPDAAISPPEVWPREGAPRSTLSPAVENDSGSSSSPVLGFLGGALHGGVGFFASGWPVAYLVATVIFGIGILIGAFTYVSQPEQVVATHSPPAAPLDAPPVAAVGRVTGMADCRWARRAVPLFVNDVVPIGREVGLESGLMEITYDSGAKVILQGPVAYEVESAAGGFLSVGKITARVGERGEGRGERGEKSAGKSEIRNPKSEVSNLKSQISNLKSLFPPPSPLSPLPSPLFTVRTPTATVTDLGTEFGVEVHKDGGTTSHVFRGLIRVQVVSGGAEADDGGRILHENESVRVMQSKRDQGGNRVVVVKPDVVATSFVRQLPKWNIKVLDLVDVVAGGDGFSGRRGRGIDPTNGRPADSQPNPRRLVGDYRYHRVGGNPFVDGVFIPDGSKGLVQLDSAGHTFDDFEKTQNATIGHIWAGGRVVLEGPTTVFRTTLGGVEYAAPGHGVLFLHANKGITFDLEAIRRASPGRKLLRFRAVAGVTETASEKGDRVFANFWVFVDGQLEFRRREISYYNGAMPVDIALANRDRFLTLVATDNNDHTRYDWTMFGDPRLELVEGTFPNPKLRRP